MKSKIIIVGIVLILTMSLIPLVGSCREAEVNVAGEEKTADTGAKGQVEGDTPAVVAPADESGGVKEDMKEDTVKSSNIPIIDANRPAVTETATFSLG